MAGLRILIGADKTAPVYEFEYSKSHIMSFSGTAASSLVGDELTVDRVTFTVNLDKYYRTLYAPTDADAYQDTEGRLYAVKEAPGTLAADLLKLEYATPVWVYQGEHLVGKFYSGDVERTAYAVVSITIESALGVLDRQQHLGGVYTGQLFPSVLNEIIGGAFPFAVSESLSAVKVYNWLPIDSKRNNIHQLLYAHGANLTKDENGDLVFDFLQQTVAVLVPDERLFLNGSAKYTPPATRVEVIEHSFFKLSTDTDVVLFDNTDGAAPAGNSFVAFQEAPVYGLTASGGLVINESGVNYAVVSGVGVLTGKRYNHQTNRVGRDNADAVGVEKIVSSDGCTLVSVLNSSNVTRRLLSYYSSAQTFSMDIAIDGEKPGDQFQFNSPFGELTTAFLASMQYSITGFMRARCELVTNYEPTPPGGGDYTRFQVVSASGTITLPEDVTEFTAVLIGGGVGGSGGYDGTAGKASGSVTASRGGTASGSGGNGGKGGAAGAGGNGGRIFQVRVEISAGAAVSLSIGAGGKGGARNGGVGSEGGPTTLTVNGVTYSSASGALSPSGYFDVMGQRIYAVAGVAGTAGGDGGAGSSDGQASGAGAAVGNYTGGRGRATIFVTSGKTLIYTKPSKASSTSTTSSTSGATVTGWPTYSTNAGAVLNNANYTVDKLTGAWSFSGGAETTVTMPTSTGSTNFVATSMSGKSITLTQLKCSKYTSTSYYYKNTVVYNSVLSESSSSSDAGWNARLCSGGGGGAATGANGSEGNQGSVDALKAGAGGNGAAGAAPAPTRNPGEGGNGGNGGGGSGGGGGTYVRVRENSYDESVTVVGGAAGTPGLGSAGGDGAPGCVLIYY